MRINELIIENQQLDELSLSGIGKGIGNAAGGVGKAIGGVAGGTVAAAQRFGQGVKQGYQDAKASVGGTTTPPAQSGTAPTVPGTTPPAQSATSGTTPPGTAPVATTPPTNTTNVGRVGAPAGKQAIDQAIKVVKSVRGDRRPQIVAYGIQQLGTVKESKVGMQSNFLGIEI